MAALIKAQNTLEGGAGGVEIATANSGESSGDAFDIVNSQDESFNVLLTFDRSSKISAVAAAKFALLGNTTAYMGWTTTIGTLTNFYVRFTLWMTDHPTGNTAIARFLDSGQVTKVVVTNEGELKIFNAANVLVGTTVPLPTETPIRIEAHITNHASAGSIVIRIYSSPDATEPLDEVSISAIDTGAQTQIYRFGVSPAAGATPMAPFWMDDLAVATGDWIGPVSVDQVARPSSTISAGDWTPVGAASLHEAIDEPVVVDADFAISSQNPVLDVMEIELGDFIEPGAEVPHDLSYRIGKDLPGGAGISFDVKLMDGATVISQWQHLNVDTLSTYTQSLTEGEVAAITDYTDLRLRFEAWAS